MQGEEEGESGSGGGVEGKGEGGGESEGKGWSLGRPWSARLPNCAPCLCAGGAKVV